MSPLRQFLTKHEALLLYIAKCVTGAILVHGLAIAFDYAGAYWCLISLVLVLTPDSTEAVPLAITRIKANTCGAVAGLLCLPLNAPVIAALCLSFAITALLCHLWSVMAGSRSAMAAVIIVMQHEPGRHVWDTAFERVTSVFLGCLLGLVITFIFHRKFPRLAPAKV